MNDPLLRIAQRVVWWERPEQVVTRPETLLCRVMALGSLDDANYVEQRFGADRLRRALTTAAPGIFDVRSWHYWHARLGLGPAGPLPVRRLA